MKTLTLAAMAVVTAQATLAEETRQLDAHEHGVGQLDIAFDGSKIAMELHAPGADIVGFEYAATSDADRAAVAAAVATLATPMDLFQIPAAAGCSVVQASASLESEEDHDDHDAHAHDEDDHDKHGHEEHAHDDHDEDGHKDEDHAAHEDDDHAHEEHAEHDEDKDHDHAAHAQAEGHTEFHATYMLDCADTAAATTITFAYFDAFPNALELEVQVITDKGANAFEVMRDAPMLDLRGMF